MIDRTPQLDTECYYCKDSRTCINSITGLSIDEKLRPHTVNPVCDYCWLHFFDWRADNDRNSHLNGDSSAPPSVLAMFDTAPSDEEKAQLKRDLFWIDAEYFLMILGFVAFCCLMAAFSD